MACPAVAKSTTANNPPLFSSKFIVRSQRGFTLIEVLVVFAIMALLLAVAPLAFERMRESAQYRNTLRTMLADMRGARYQAMAQGRETRFVIDLQQRTYGIEGQPQQDLPEALDVRVTVADQELAPNQEAAIRFLPSGGATGGSVDVIRPAGSGVRLRVDWLTGQAEQEALPP